MNRNIPCLLTPKDPLIQKRTNRRVFLILGLLICIWPNIANAQSLRLKEPVKFLALGDSYTIGEAVSVNERWPVQLFDSLARRGFETEKLTIIARTGWTADDLKQGILIQNPAKEYNLVALLIGVNDQYQGLNKESYKTRFEELLVMAIELAQGDKDAVFVLSIPDYAYTPFGQGSRTITEEIDEFNNINQAIAQAYEITYIDITPISREGLNNPGLVAGDGLHPSGLMYSRWVSLVLEEIADRQITNESEVESPGPEMKVFPNPASDFIEFRLSGGKGEDYVIMIYNTVGQVVASLELGGRSTIRQDTSAWKPGIYHYKFTSRSGNGIRGSFMIV
jgi:lysophospholipase L1-like esterase